MGGGWICGARGAIELRRRSVFFFFFQAEDGIRDHCVTGVQTCALPISILSRNSFLLRIAKLFCPTSIQLRILLRTHRSEERRVGKGVDLGGRRISKKNKARKARPPIARAWPLAAPSSKPSVSPTPAAHR